MAEMRKIAITVNGRQYEETVETRHTLADFLRQQLGLTGTHLGCEHGVCGACTVLLDGRPVSSCTTLALEADGRRVETIEGLADEGAGAPGGGDRGRGATKLHPLQEAFIDRFAFQCGYCTPGMIVSAKALLEERPSPDRADVRRWMEGNICRCTGYESIVEAVLDASERIRAVAVPAAKGVPGVAGAEPLRERGAGLMGAKRP